jgi:hypothetical protein
MRATAGMTTSAIDTMKMRPRLGDVRAHPVRETTTRKMIAEIGTMTCEDSSATATRAIETRTAIRETCSCGTSTCRADLTERLSVTAHGRYEPESPAVWKFDDGTFILRHDDPRRGTVRQRDLHFDGRLGGADASADIKTAPKKISAITRLHQTPVRVPGARPARPPSRRTAWAARRSS